MGADGKSHEARLAIRTIMVTTREAVSTQVARGRRDHARHSVRRGGELLDRLPRRVKDRAGAAVEHARAELESLDASVNRAPRAGRPH